MKIAENNIRNYISDSKIITIIYGQDQGVVIDRVNDFKVSMKKNGYEIFNIDNDSIKDNPMIIEEEFMEFSMFSTKKFIVIDRVKSEITKTMEELSSKNGIDNKILAIYDNLTPSSKIRQFGEKSNDVGIIACYEDTKESLAVFIKNLLDQNGLKYDRDVVEYIAQNLNRNRIDLRSEVGKLGFLENGKVLTREDIKNILVSDLETNIDELISAFFNHSLIRSPVCAKNLQDKIDYIPIIRKIGNYAIKLYQVQCFCNDGLSQDLAIEKLSEKIFWKDLPIFKKHLQVWNKEELFNLIKKVNNLEIFVKTNNVSVTNVIIKNFLLI